MATYNLIDEPWIPFVNHDGTVGHAGLLEALSRAHEMREIFDSSPLVNAALHRLLLAILHRNFGPKNRDEWKALWAAGRWNDKVLGAYFEKWRDRFDLFHSETPFYQVQEMPSAQRHPVRKLAVETATGNNATLFDHSFDDKPVPTQPAEAARLLVASQAFSVGGGVSKPFNFCHAPLVDGYTVMPLGSNVFETLALNLTP